MNLKISFFFIMSLQIEQFSFHGLDVQKNLLYLNQPVNENGSHFFIDVKLVGHIIRTNTTSNLRVITNKLANKGLVLMLKH